MLELQTGGAHFGPGPTVVAPSMPSYVEVPTPYSNGWTHPGATGGGSMLVPATRAPTYNPCETPRSAYDDWWCNEGRRQGVPWGAATWGGSVNGLGHAVSELLGEEAPGWKSALLGLAVVTGLAFVLTAGAERVLGLKRNGSHGRRRMRRNGAIVLNPAQAAALAPFNAAAAQGGWTLESVLCGVVVYRRAAYESAVLIVDGQGKTRGFKIVTSGKARAKSKGVFLDYLDGTVICEFGLKENGRRRRRLRRNGATTRVVVTLEPNGRFTGHVLDAATGQALAVTYAEASPFDAKREADKLALRIERARAKAERSRPKGPYRVTPTGRTIALVPRKK